jgi:hypothetical protein
MRLVREAKILEKPLVAGTRRPRQQPASDPLGFARRCDLMRGWRLGCLDRTGEVGAKVAPEMDGSGDAAARF